MQPQLQRLEGQAALDRDDDLAVEDELAGFQGTEGRRDIREIPPQALARFRAQFDVLAIPEGEATEAIPFGFVPPMFAFR